MSYSNKGASIDNRLRLLRGWGGFSGILQKNWMMPKCKMARSDT